MAPKKGAKGKKNKKDDWSGDDDPASLNDKLAQMGLKADSDDEAPVSQPRKSAFAAFQLEDGIDQEDLEDDGGLMGAIQQANTQTAPTKKSKKKQAQRQDSDEEDVPAVNTKGPVQVTADDLDFSEDDKKSKKSKKKSNAKAETQEANVEANDEEDISRPLSKKEKEKLKKQRQKEKEKAAKSASKPAAAVASSTVPQDSTEPPTEVVEDVSQPTAPNGEEEEVETGAKSKKKKKKTATKEDAPAASAKAPGKPVKVSKQVLAMREALAAKQAAEEAQRAAEEAEQRRIEEEERREKEEKDKLEAARLAKKQRQKEKEAQAKKEGKWKSPAQKKEEARAEAARQALLASGVKVAGLEEKDGSTAAVKRPVYTNKKKPQAKRQGPKETVTLIDSSSNNATEAQPDIQVDKEAVTQTLEPSLVDGTAGDAKDDWDAESEKEDVKDSWDAESGEEESAPAKSSVPAQKVDPVKGKEAKASVSEKATPTQPQPASSTSKQPSKPQLNGVAPKKQVIPSKAAEESSEEESSSEESDTDEETSSEDDSDEESSEEEHISAAQQLEMKRKAEAAERKKKRIELAMAARSKEDLRSPICCILGHVDTGKTKLLDKIRQTNVQEGEAGGITQQIGATFFPVETIKQKTEILGEDNIQEYKLPGLLVIDTPGHESFTNLRSRGSSLCNIAILVVDIVHGLEPQTLESLRLLRDKKTPFIVALNKIDRCYGWKAIPNAGFKQTIAQQSSSTVSEYESRLKRTILEFAEQGLNAAPYYENKDLGRTVSLVPTSAITGEGIPDMLMLITKLTQERMANNLMYLSETECTVLEVKVIEGLGTTIDVVLTNGFLKEGDKIVVCGLNGAIVTQIRALLTPQPLKEMRVRGQYVHHKEVKASLGIKIVAPDLEKAIAGSRLLLVTEDDDEEELKKEIMQDLTSLLNSVDRSGKGVWVQASTLGSLEALLDFLKVSKIPVAGINIGPVHKKDIVRASVMLERAPEFAVCLCFDVPIDKDAEKLAEELGLKMFKADIIYHLFDAFTAHNAAVLEAKQKDSAPAAVWPCRLKILACFAKRDPIILGCDLLEGTIRIGTPLCVVKKNAETGKKDIISLGKITSLEINHKPQTKVMRSNIGAGVAVKIECAAYETAKMYGRHFDDKDEVVSMVSRTSIDVLKTVFRDEVAKEDWQLIVKLKALLDVA